MKIKLGIISGSGAYDLGMEVLEEFEAETPYGKPSSKVQIVEINGNRAAFIRRHGPEHTIPPHRINHRANIYALRDLGTDRIISIGSVGSLKEGIKPPAIVIPEDYISPFRVDTFFDDKVEHITPEMDDELRKELRESALSLGIDVHFGGVYIQTLGPRLETKAEIRMYSRFADIVGMTVGSEATLSQELGIGFAAICSVDNYAHGIGGEVPEFRVILERSKVNQEKTKAIVRNLLERLQ
jgi:5'-methylthioadenosine phosphorylase